MRAIVPVHELRRKVAEQGRIRMGVKDPVLEGGKPKMKDGKPVTRPKKLKRLRFTSGDHAAMRKIQELYGGTLEPWPEGPTPGQLQITIEAEKVPIVLPPDPLSGTPIYELWSGGGCLRRCDGVDATLALADTAAPDAQPAVVPCVCREQDSMACKPRTRLNVVLKDVPFGGTWRIESTGWHAVEELPGMVDLVLQVQGSGMSAAELSIAQRTSMVRGRRNQYVVPMLSLPESIQALADGRMRLGALAPAAVPRPELEAGPEDVDEEWFDPDDEVADAEIVPDETVAAGTSAEVSPDSVPRDAEAETAATPAKKRTGQTSQAKAIHAALNDLMKVPEIAEQVDVDVMRHGLIRLVTDGASQSSKDVSPDQARQAVNLIADMLSGDRRFIGIAEDGRARVSAHKGAP